MAERRIVLDIEGTDSADRGRVIELGMVEMVGSRVTARSWSSLFWPDNEPISPYATKVHGYRLPDLRGRPRFGERIGEIFDFIGDARIFAHGSESDRMFMNKEMAIAGKAPLGQERFFDTQKLAARRFKGEKTSMDALIANVLGKVRPKFHKGIDDARFLAEILAKIAPPTAQDLAAYMNDRSKSPKRKPLQNPVLNGLKIGDGVGRGLAGAIGEARSVDDATSLKVGGHDLWSKLPREDLDPLLQRLTGRGDYRDEMTDLSSSRQNGVLRWVGRGLSFDLALDREREFARREEDPSPSP